MNSVTNKHCPAHTSYEACTICYGVHYDAGELANFREETFAEFWESTFAKQQRSALFS